MTHRRHARTRRVGTLCTMRWRGCLSRSKNAARKSHEDPRRSTAAVALGGGWLRSRQYLLGVDACRKLLGVDDHGVADDRGVLAGALGDRLLRADAAKSRRAGAVRSVEHDERLV